MSARLLLVGPLAEPAMMAALGLEPAGAAVTLPGRLSGGGRAGIALDGWPGWDREAPGQVTAQPVAASEGLRRYAEIMDLQPVEAPQGRVMGTVPGTRPEDGPFQRDLAARVAADLLARDPDQPAEAIRARLPMIAWWAASRLRAAAERGEALPPGPRDQDRLRIESRREPYGQYFSVESLRLTHRLHQGGWSEPLERAVFVSGDAVVVLPWDPDRDRVLLVDQFRAGPAARGDGQPWIYEPVAGRIDAGETPESTALREAVEEAGLTLSRLIPAPAFYPTPGIAAEFIYGFIGIADLPDGVATVTGLPSEGEDIRGQLVSRDELMRMVLDGRIVSGPLMILALWLNRMADELKRGLAPG
ncbi:NUDIX domain-containing protein [Paracoccus chinensis]|uniref:ADP-ribose pyrophosphatase n=1 Tax=Paracoccus chinensis TaxID=525640 RepID=A0A1G9HHI0_9RHOB|nr:NUDIX domain-containing protein [Paracoccus chinensis]SDL12345.1 nudix-type nucleoside diphosphatase, YffH/AdpP family [Paracoccus chinensis]